MNENSPKNMVVHVHLLSDSTGETVTSLARACMVQFDHVDYQEHIWSLIRNEIALYQAMESMKQNPGIVLFTIVDPDIRKKLTDFCMAHHMPAFSVMDHFLDIFSKYLGMAYRVAPGAQHQLDSDYFARIDAMQYALNHDDGLGDASLKEADILVTGVSRTSKTPTCMYLANRGYKAANIPMVPAIDLPTWMTNRQKGQKPIIVCLVRDAESLVQIRKNRLNAIMPSDEADNHIFNHNETDYVNLEKVKQEIITSKRLSVQNGWPIIDVTRRSIEESAAAIINIFETNP